MKTPGAVRILHRPHSYLSNATCLTQASFVLCAFRRVKDHHSLLPDSPLLKKAYSSTRLRKACVRQVVLDKRLPLNFVILREKSAHYSQNLPLLSNPPDVHDEGRGVLQSEGRAEGRRGRGRRAHDAAFPLHVIGAITCMCALIAIYVIIAVMYAINLVIAIIAIDLCNNSYDRCRT